jgi:hypothetical protein
MGRIWEPAMTPTSSAPETQGMLYTTGQTFIKGAYLVFNGATGEVIEGTSPNPAAIVGVALDAPGSHPGFQLNFDSAVVARTGTTQQVGVAKANRLTIFSGRMVNGGTDPVTPALTDIGVSYEVLKTGAGEWVVNQAATTNNKVKIVDIDAASKIVFFRFLEAVLAQP